jgi:hypothetical protein
LKKGRKLVFLCRGIVFETYPPKNTYWAAFEGDKEPIQIL